MNVQLPQKFNTELLKSAHEKAVKEEKKFTEDASLLYYYDQSVRIRIMEGTEYNIKITNPIDMVIGDMIYREYFQRRA